MSNTDLWRSQKVEKLLSAGIKIFDLELTGLRTLKICTPAFKNIGVNKFRGL